MAAWLIALLGCTALVAFFDLSGGADFEPTDAWVSQTAREMYENTNWRGYVIPRFSGEVRMQKSPGPYWAVCLTAWLRGTSIDEASTRIPNGIATLLLVATIFWLTRRIAGDRAAVFAGFAAASSAFLLHWSHRGASDLGATAFMALSLAALWIGSEVTTPGRKQVALWLLGYFAAGLAMLYKQPMPLVGVGIPALLYVLICNRWRIFSSWWHLAGLVVFCLPWAPWMIALAALQSGAASETVAAVTSAAPAAATDFWTTLAKWKVEYWDRLTGDLPNVEDQQRDWRMYFLYAGVAFVFAMPWSLSIPQALARGFRRDESINRLGMRFLLIWLLGLFVFFTIPAGKETRYFLPAMPPLLCLLGIELSRFFDPQRAASRKVDTAAFVTVTLLAPLGWGAGAYALHKLTRLYGEYSTFAWEQIWPPYAVTAAIFSAGAILASWLYRVRRENAAFGTLVATMFATFLWSWSSLAPILANEAPFRDFARQLREKLTPEQHAALYQVAQQDSRIIWYSDVRFPRVIDQLELLRMQGGVRDREKEMRIVAGRMVELLRSEKLVLFVCEPAIYALFQIGVDAKLRTEPREPPLPPATHTWIIAGVGRPDHRYVVFGNWPPAWDEPAFALPRPVIDEILKRFNFEPSDVSKRLTMPKPELASLSPRPVP